MLIHRAPPAAVTRLRSPWIVRLVLVVLVTLTAGLLLTAPVWTSLIAVVAGVGAWCYWLERHPDPPQR